jgi:hypothetical protein
LEKPIQHDNSGDFGDLWTHNFADFFLFLFHLDSNWTERRLILENLNVSLFFLSSYNLTTIRRGFHTVSPGLLSTICLSGMVRIGYLYQVKFIQRGDQPILIQKLRIFNVFVTLVISLGLCVYDLPWNMLGDVLLYLFAC